MHLPRDEPLERDVKADIRALLTERRAYQFWPVQSGRGKRAHDIIVCYRGYFLSIEVKRSSKEVPTGPQQRIMKEVGDADGISFVAWDADLVRRVLDTIDSYSDRSFRPAVHPV